MNLLHTIHRAEQAADELFSRYVKGYDVTFRQATLLACLKVSPGASQTALVNATGIDRSTVADMVPRLQRRGWLTRRRTKEDARAYAVKLTDEGVRVLKQAESAAAMAEKELIVQMPRVRHLVNGRSA